jgi:uncharacterized protein YqjF (DUF2071 family)
MTSTPPIFLTAGWRDLVLLNYEVDPAILRERIPAGTQLDLWQGRALVSVVGFHFDDTRVRGWAIPRHRHFPEVNLRFYVTRKTPGGLRRGVVFIREFVPRRAVALIARWLYGENYLTLPMRQEIVRPSAENNWRGHFAYAWRHGGRWHRLAAGMSGPAALAAEGTEEHFITEHYWGYTRQPDGGAIEYQVEHPPWKLWRATAPVLDADVAALYGPSLAEYLSRPPSSAFAAEGSAIVVRRGVRID